jgi:hypothetical protein
MCGLSKSISSSTQSILICSIIGSGFVWAI